MRCSVVFGVTLRILVINISSSSLAINTVAYYQRCVTTSGTRPCSTGDSVDKTWLVAAPAAGTKDRYRLRIAMPLPLVWKNHNGVATRLWKNFGDMFIRFDIIEERDRQTDTAWRHRPPLCIASRGKNRRAMDHYTAIQWLV